MIETNYKSIQHDLLDKLLDGEKIKLFKINSMAFAVFKPGKIIEEKGTITIYTGSNFSKYLPIEVKNIYAIMIPLGIDSLIPTVIFEGDNTCFSHTVPGSPSENQNSLVLDIVQNRGIIAFDDSPDPNKYDQFQEEFLSMFNDENAPLFRPVHIQPTLE